MTDGGLPGVSVVPADVAAVGRFAHDTAKTLHDALTAVAREIETLTTSGWTGDAAKGFYDGWRECRDGGEQILQALLDMAAKLGGDAAAYQGRDEDNASLYQLPELNL